MIPRSSEPPASSPASLRATLAEIDAELASLRARVEELAAARKPIMDALKSIVYPILTIPVEITAEIFLHVCTQWRAVALNLQPIIWSRLRIGVTLEEVSKLEELLAGWVPRAGDQLLDIDMTKSDAKLLTALVPHSTRWKSLIYDFSSGFGYSTGLDTIQGRIPHLETLRIDLEIRAPSRNMLSGFSAAPALRKVYLSGLGLNRFTLPWWQLTTLGLGGDFAPTCAEILQATPQLQILHLKAEREPHGWAGPVLPMTLHHLHTLELRGDGDDFQYQIGDLLGAFTLPALQDLRLGGMPEDETIVQLLTRSDCSLVSISFHSPDLHLLLSMLDAVRTPSEVHITDIDWTLHQLNYFFLGMDESSGRLPNLRTLSMSSRLADLPYAAMAKMLASRQGSEEGCARIESFQFTLLPQLTPIDDDSEEFVMIDNVSAQGCRVEIQGLRGLKLNPGSNADSGAAHSYTLEPSY
ncbi:hypothetical protein C8R46DRAFT_1286668 [Mycena filopes]|nr:hypothetical protein C8R46DRAFT_1286668 [Mycena filopes]